MRRGRILLVGLLVASVALPTAVDARPRVFGILGALFGGIAGVAGAHHYRHHRHVIATRNHQQQPSEERASTAGAAPPPQSGEPQAEKPPGLQLPPPPASLANLPEADFARTDEEFFGFVFSPASYETRFWAHGERDMIQAVFTKGVTGAPPDCSQTGAERVNPLIERLEQATSPSEEQSSTLSDLRSALTKAYNQINATCREVNPLTPTARLKAMQERLFAIRNAGLSVRTSLASFYDSLSEQQKARFDNADTTNATEAKAGGSAEQICTAQVQAAYAWPSAQIGRRVRPSEQQRASLEALQKTLFGMAVYLKGACQADGLKTPVARLDAAMRRLDAMLYAVIAISPALDDFYGQLTDEQKARFNSIDRAST
jgi:LTXXQ motif family protein